MTDHERIFDALSHEPGGRIDHPEGLVLAVLGLHMVNRGEPPMDVRALRTAVEELEAMGLVKCGYVGDLRVWIELTEAAALRAMESDQVGIAQQIVMALHEASVASSGQAGPEDTAALEGWDDETLFARILEGHQTRNATRLASIILADDEGEHRVIERFLDKAPPSVTRQLAELALWGEEDTERLAHLLELSFETPPPGGWFCVEGGR